MQLTHLGHSCLLVEVEGTRLLFDPGSFSEFDDVSDLDAILITHQHPDHLDQDKLPDLMQRNPGATLYADPETAHLLADKEIAVTAAVPGEDFRVGEITVTPVGDRHAVITEYVPTLGNVGYYLSAPGQPSLFHPGDALDAEVPGDVDLLAVPVSAPWCAVKETVAFVRRIAPGAVVPIHDGLLTPPARGIYLQHIGGYGRDGGIPVRDLRGEGTVTA